MRLGLVLCALSLGLLIGAPAVSATDEPTGAAVSKGKKKPSKCKRKKVAVAINGRKRCLPLTGALPRPRAADPRLLAAQAALGVDLGKVRDRRGRRAVAIGKLLGSKRMRTAQRAIQQGLTTLDRLKVKAALASASASPLATASAQGCASQADRPERSAEFKGKGFDAKVDLGKGAAQIGVDLGEGGVRAEIDFALCEDADDKFKAPDCPDAEGTLEASDQTSFYVSIRIFRDSELLLSQNIEFSGETAIKPIQVDDDAKIEYFDVEHTYRTGVEVGGSSQEFGRVSLKLTYHGSTRVNFPGATYDPTHTDVEVKLDVEGADPHDLREVEFDQGLKAKAEADKNFAAAVDKAIAKLGEKEKGWNVPNRCADLTFDPVSDTLTLLRSQTGAFKARVAAKQGGSPPSAKWTRLSAGNATIGPVSALANPATFGYTVTNAGPGIYVTGAFKVVSRVGVAEGTWTQNTKEDPPPPPPPSTMSGSISGTADYDAVELGAGNQLHAQWNGAVKLTLEPPLAIPGFPTNTFSYRLTSGSIFYSFTGEVEDCHVAGVGPIDLGAQIDLTSGSSLTLFDQSPRAYQYVIPAPLLVQVHGTQSSCPDPEDNGDFSWLPGAGVPALVNAPKGGSVAEDWALSGAGEGDTGAGSPDQTWAWDLAPGP